MSLFAHIRRALAEYVQRKLAEAKTGEKAACNALLSKRNQWGKEQLDTEAMPVPDIMYQDFRYRRDYEP